MNPEAQLLVVEDDKVTALLASKILQKNGYRVVHAATGEEALALLAESSQGNIDLVLTDIDLGPGLDGIETARHILERHDLPIAFVTSHTEKEVVEEVKDITKYGYVIKESGEFVLIEAVEMALKLFAAGQESRRHRQRLQAIMDTSPMAMSTTDSEGRIDYANAMARSLLALSFDQESYRFNDPKFSITDAQGRPLPEKDLPFARVKKTLRPLFRVEHAIQPTDQGYTLLSINSAPLLDEQGGFAGTVNVLDDITKQRETEEQLARQQEELSAIYENSPILMVLVDSNRIIRKANIMADYFEYPQGATVVNQSIGQALNCLHHLDHPKGCGFGPFCSSCSLRQSVQYTLEANESIPKFEVEVPISSQAQKDAGVEKWAYFYCSTVLLHLREESLVLVSLEEITDLKKTQEELNQQKQNYIKLFDNSPTGIFVTTSTGQVLHVNPAMARMAGARSPQEAIRTFSSLWYDLYADSQRRQEFLELLQERGAVENFEYEAVILGGGHRWFSMNAAIRHYEPDGSFVIDGFVSDVTERREAEEALRRSEERFKLAVEGSQDGLWDWDLTTNTAYHSDRFATMLGYESEELPNTNAAWSRLLHPDDQQLAWQQVQQYLAGYASRYESIFRMKAKDGSWRWIKGRGKALYDEQGTAKRFVGFNTDITESKIVEDQLRHSQERWRKLSRLTFEGILLHKNGIVFDANTSLARMLGYSHEELIGSNIIELAVPENYQAVVRNKILEQPSRPYEIMGRRKDGSVFPAELEGRNIEEGGDSYRVVAVRDITERKKTEQKLAESQSQLKAIVENTREAIIIVQNGYLVYTNPAMESLTGYTPEELAASPFTAFIHDEDRDMVLTNHQKRVQGEALPPKYDFRIVAKDGSVKWVQITATPFTWKGHSSTLNLLTEITRRKHTELEIALAKEEAVRANRAKSDFLATMSHEIRTPMNGIIGMTDLALGAEQEGERQEYLNTVKSSAYHLLQIINDILDLSKIEADKLELSLDVIDFSEMVNTLANVFHYETRTKELDFAVEYHSQIPRWIYGDVTRLRQVIFNLLSNAVKFTHEGRITLIVSRIRDPRRLTELHLDSERDYLQISVKDTGVGIPEEKIETIFSPFEQQDKSTTRQFGGTGLGLAICRRIADLMHGRIRVRSVVGQGSEFFFCFPLNEIESGQEGATEGIDSPAQASQSATPVPGQSRLYYNILVAEDNEVNAKLARVVLEREGHTVTLVGSGPGVLTKLCKNHYDLILMDIEMPEIDGLEATRRIRAGECGENKAAIPIVAMTAHALAYVKEQAETVGMNDYITKPVDINKLKQTIAQIMSEARE